MPHSHRQSTRRFTLTPADPDKRRRTVTVSLAEADNGLDVTARAAFNFYGERVSILIKSGIGRAWAVAEAQRALRSHPAIRYAREA